MKNQRTVLRPHPSLAGKSVLKDGEDDTTAIWGRKTDEFVEGACPWHQMSVDDTIRRIRRGVGDGQTIPAGGIIEALA